MNARRYPEAARGHLEAVLASVDWDRMERSSTLKTTPNGAR